MTLPTGFSFEEAKFTLRDFDGYSAREWTNSHRMNWNYISGRWQRLWRLEDVRFRASIQYAPKCRLWGAQAPSLILLHLKHDLTFTNLKGILVVAICNIRP